MHTYCIHRTQIWSHMHIFMDIYGDVVQNKSKVLEYPGKDGHNMASHSAASPSELNCPDYRTAKGQKPWWHAWSRDVEDPISSCLSVSLETQTIHAILCKPLTMKHVHFSCYEFMCISFLFNLLNLLQYLNLIHVLATGGFHEHTSPFSTILEANGVKEDGNRHHDHCTFLASARFEPIKTTRKH